MRGPGVLHQHPHEQADRHRVARMIEKPDRKKPEHQRPGRAPRGKAPQVGPGPLGELVAPAEQPGAERLVGVPFEEITFDASPHGEKRFALWNPPLVDEESGARRSALSESSWLLGKLVEEAKPLWLIAAYMVISLGGFYPGFNPQPAHLPAVRQAARGRTGLRECRRHSSRAVPRLATTSGNRRWTGCRPAPAPRRLRGPAPGPVRP